MGNERRLTNQLVKPCGSASALTAKELVETGGAASVLAVKVPVDTDKVETWMFGADRIEEVDKLSGTPSLGTAR